MFKKQNAELMNGKLPNCEMTDWQKLLSAKNSEQQKLQNGKLWRNFKQRITEHQTLLNEEQTKQLTARKKQKKMSAE